MLARLTELRSYRVTGKDGDIGRIDDLCFRENEWIVRYVAVDMEDLERESLLLSAYLGSSNRQTHLCIRAQRRNRQQPGNRLRGAYHP